MFQQQFGRLLFYIQSHCFHSKRIAANGNCLSVRYSVPFGTSSNKSIYLNGRNNHENMHWIGLLKLYHIANITFLKTSILKNYLCHLYFFIELRLLLCITPYPLMGKIYDKIKMYA